VIWTLGVLGWDVADVAVLLGGEEVQVFEVPADPALFDDLVAVAQDFRRRLADGGPFARDTARIKRDYPADDGSEMAADPDLTAAVKALVDLRSQRKRMEDSEAAIEDAIKARMGPVARLMGDGFTVTWRRTKDVTTTDWKALSDGLLRQLPEEQREPLIGLHSSLREGFRPFRVVVASKED
jgi:predicted phage-related endonuclease